MANKEHVAILKRGVNEWNKWREKYRDVYPDLSGTDLRKTELNLANLSRINLNRANLSESDLTDAKLSMTDLSGADLIMTNMNNADLSGTDLSSADMNSANLSNAKLSRADLSSARLNHTNFHEVTLIWTTFDSLDLSEVKELETARHRGPSIVNINSVILPLNEQVRQHFLRGTGFSDTLIEYLPSLLTTPLQYYSLFISYSHKDEVFAHQLHHDLQDKGVRCWFAPHNLRPGTPILRGIEEAIHWHEKTLLVLSRDAVGSAWVEHEVETALYREIERKQDVLFPIRLDNTVLESGAGWARRLRHRHIGDFTHWQNKTAYAHALTTLLRHLKINSPR